MISTTTKIYFPAYTLAWLVGDKEMPLSSHIINSAEQEGEIVAVTQAKDGILFKIDIQHLNPHLRITFLRAPGLPIDEADRLFIQLRYAPKYIGQEN